MGHVDHGKTTLLDRIRHANVVAGEAGGITQHIGAYQVDARRPAASRSSTRRATRRSPPCVARGAQVTDIAILVVAADDGVMPQTVEAISHARAAEVPIVVAVTKVDREDADPTRVRQQLTENELVPEEWGGDTIVVDVSAPTGDGVDELLDSHRCSSPTPRSPRSSSRTRRGRRAAYVLESNLDQGRGPVVTALVEEGTLRVGDTIVAGRRVGPGPRHVRRARPSRSPRPVRRCRSRCSASTTSRSRATSCASRPTDKIARTVAEARAHRRKAAALRNPMMLARRRPSRGHLRDGAARRGRHARTSS